MKQIKILDKIKIAKEAAKIGVGGVQGKISEIQKQDKEFKEKELEILGEFEDKIDSVLDNQKLILSKLNEIEQEMK